MRALLLAASDMEQAIAAAHALDAEQTDWNLMRALETAIAVCYARAFTKSQSHQLDRAEYEPADPTLAQMHRQLIYLRDQVYAHTDKPNRSGRSAGVSITSLPEQVPGRVDFMREEEWVPLPRGLLPTMLELFNHQRDMFHEKAGKMALFLAAGHR